MRLLVALNSETVDDLFAETQGVFTPVTRTMRYWVFRDLSSGIVIPSFGAWVPLMNRAQSAGFEVGATAYGVVHEYHSTLRAGVGVPFQSVPRPPLRVSRSPTMLAVPSVGKLMFATSWVTAREVFVQTAEDPVALVAVMRTPRNNPISPSCGVIDAPVVERPALVVM